MQHEQQTETIDLAVTSGLAPGGKLRANRMFSITPTGCTFTGIMPKDQVTEALMLMRRLKTIYHVALSDILAHARQHHGDEFVEQTCVQLEFEELDVHRATIIGSIPPACRLPSLTSEHYYAVARAELPDEEAADWLQTAVRERLTPIDLSRAIQTGVLPKHDVAARRGGVATVQGLRMLFDSWSRRVAKNDPVERWDEARLRELLIELEPIERTILTARARLQGGKV